MYNDNCEELTKELIAYKLYNNGQTPVLPKYDLTICKRTMHEYIHEWLIATSVQTVIQKHKVIIITSLATIKMCAYVH